jgi:putative ABC transport system substrate-binding protein
MALLTATRAPPPAEAQTKIPRVGVIANLKNDPMFEVLERALASHGWVKGKTVTLDYRVTGGDAAQIVKATEDLVRLEADVIFSWSAPALRAAYGATRDIPIVAMDLTTEPVAAGYAESYSRPGRNVTGVFLDAPEFAVKWLESMRTIVPGLSRVAVLWDPGTGTTHLEAARTAARTFGVQVQVLEVRTPGDIDRAFSAFRGHPQAVILLPSPIMYASNKRFAELVVKHRLPATSIFREFAEAGGALSYGPSQAETIERGAALVASILRGTKPGDLPIDRPNKFDFIVNLKALKALGLSVPDSVLLRADEVIR